MTTAINLHLQCIILNDRYWLHELLIHTMFYRNLVFYKISNIKHIKKLLQKLIL